MKTANIFLTEAARKLANCDRSEAFELWATQLLADRAQRHAAVHRVWLSIADAAPALGMAGTVIGLIGMFAAMDDPAALGPAMALALLTTFYGVVIANMIAAPIAAVPPAPEGPGLIASMADLCGPACKWPIGDPKAADFSFCGRPTEGAHPYCAGHGAAAFRPGKRTLLAKDPVIRRVLAGLAA